jgi:hypothetical protein
MLQTEHSNGGGDIDDDSDDDDDDDNNNKNNNNDDDDDDDDKEEEDDWGSFWTIKITIRGKQNEQMTSNFAHKLVAKIYMKLYLNLEKKDSQSRHVEVI